MIILLATVVSAVGAAYLLAGRQEAGVATRTRGSSQAETSQQSTGDAPPRPPRAEKNDEDPARRLGRSVAIRGGEDPASDPTSDSYDPIRLSNLGNDSEEIFENEPRDEEWASEREQTLQTIISGDLEQMMPRAKVKSVKCRTMTCRFVVAAPRENVRQMMFSLQWAGLAPRMTILGPKKRGRRVFQELFVLYNGDTRASVDFESWYQERRANGIARWNRAPNGPPFPIPEE